MTRDPMRTVMHLIHTRGAGGAETILLRLVENLDPARWRSVATVPEGSWLSEALAATSAPVVLTPQSHPFDLALVVRLVRAARSEGVDLIHSHLFGPAVYGSLITLVAGIPLVATIHGGVDLLEAHRWWGAKKHLLRRSGVHVVTVTGTLKEEAARELSIDSRRIQVIPNGIDTDMFSPAPSRRLRQELGWTERELIVGAVGNIRRPKDYRNLLEAAHRVRVSCPQCRFVVVGDTAGEPDLMEDLLELRASLGLDEHVVFAGFRPDIAEILNNFDIFVMSSSREGLPLALLQAMATQLPVVATRCGGPDDLLTDGRDGILVPPANPRALADALERLAADPEERGRLAGAARVTVKRGHALSRMTAEYEALYREALAHGDGNARPRLP